MYQYNDGGRSEVGFKGTTDDCVCRAIAIATYQPYKKVYSQLKLQKAMMSQTKLVRGSHPRTGVSRKVYQEYLERIGWRWIPTMQIGSGCQVHLRKNELPKGRIIARLSRHLVAVIDGVTQDTFDCTRDGTRCVYGYYVPPNFEKI